MENAGILLEQVKRLEQDLSGLTADTEEDQEVLSSELEKRNVSAVEKLVDNLRNKGDWTGKRADKSDPGQGMLEKTGEETVNLAKETGDERDLARQMDDRSDGEEKREERPALAVQLERMDQAVSVPAGPQLGRQEGQGGGDGYPLSLSGPRAGGSRLTGMPETEWAAGSGAPGLRSDPGWELLWAEQADRAFRRDSRRYDGGFYLY